MQNKIDISCSLTRLKTNSPLHACAHTYTHIHIYTYTYVALYSKHSWILDLKIIL